MWRRSILATLAVAAIAVTVIAGASGTRAASQSHAVLVIDLGDGNPRIHKLSFSGEVSGLAVLLQAGYEPVTRSFGGLGVAVCALTVDAQIRGCPADSTCLLCANPRYWGYSRDVDQSGAFSASRLGPGSTVVRDGDVEAWRWGTGDPPRYVSFDSQFPPPSTAPTTAPTTAPPTSATAGIASPPTISTAPTETTRPSAVNPGGVTTTARNTAPTGTTAAVDTTTTGSSTTGSSATGRGTASSSSADGPPVVRAASSSAAGLAAFAAFVVGLVALIILVHRSRSAVPR